MLKPFTFRNRYRKAYCERNNCHRSLSASLRLLLHGGQGPHSRRMDADAAKQRTVAYLSGRSRGNRCFCRSELITILSAKTAASVCLYSVYRKQERSLFTAALEQTSNVPTAIILPRPTAGLCLPYPASGWRSRPSVALHVCVLTGAPRRRRLGRCSPFHAPIPPASSGVQRGRRR